MTLSRETIEAAQRRLDAGIAAACIRAGQVHRIEEMLASTMTLQQVQAALQQPAVGRAPQPPYGGRPGGEFEPFAAQEAFARMRAPAPASPPGPSPFGGGAAAFRNTAWPAGRG
jgi:hypothetical protein